MGVEDNRFKLLYLGFGQVGQPIVEGSIRAINQIAENTALADQRVLLTVVYGSSQQETEVRKALQKFEPATGLFDFELVNRQALPSYLEKNNDFDFISISAGARNEDAELRAGIHTHLVDAGFDISDGSLDYRLAEEVPNNWQMIRDYAALFSEFEVTGLVDIFTNQSDVMAYVWASVTQDPLHVVGNNHLDTVRVRFTLPVVLEEMVGERTSYPNFTNVAAGYHGDGVVPLLAGYRLENGVTTEALQYMDSEELYQRIKQEVRAHARTHKASNMDIRFEALQAYRQIMQQLLTGRTTLGMSTFTRATENPLLTDYFDQNPMLQHALGEDQGIFIGGGTTIQYSDGFHWQHELPPTMAPWAQADYVAAYTKMARFIDRTVQDGLLQRVTKPQEPIDQSKQTAIAQLRANTSYRSPDRQYHQASSPG